MDAKLQKSLTDLIDDTLSELEELRKSRFAASEIKIEGPGDGIAGKPSNGDLHAKAEDKKDKDDEDDEDMDKREGKNSEADPDAGHHKPIAGEGAEHGAGPDKGGQSGHSDRKGGKNSEADPGEIGPIAKKEDKDKKKKDDDKDAPQSDEPGHEEKEKKMAQKLLDMHKGEMKKSAEEAESLMKTFVEQRVKPLEDKLTTILELVNKIAEQPVPAKGITAKQAGTPLFKSEGDGGEPLSKAEFANKLFELKKSGTKVDSLDIAKAEMGQDLDRLSKKYQLS